MSCRSFLLPKLSPLSLSRCRLLSGHRFRWRLPFGCCSHWRLSRLLLVRFRPSPWRLLHCGLLRWWLLIGSRVFASQPCRLLRDPTVTLLQLHKLAYLGKFQ